MADKNKHLDNLTVAAIALIILAVLYFAYYILMGLRAPSASFNYSLGQFKVVNSAALNAVKGLNACGDWPITAVSLSSDRGNPFNRKSSVLPQMVATSTALCAPVTQ